MMNKPLIPSNLFFVTATVVGWADIFTRKQYRDIFYETLRFYLDDGRFSLHCYVLMTNHIHLIVSGNPVSIAKELGNVKRTVSSKVKALIFEDFKESRRGWMGKMFENSGLKNSKTLDFQFWKHDPLPPFPMWSPRVVAQKFHYIHHNPVAMGLVAKPEYWMHSSAPQYAGLEATFSVEMLDVLY